MTGPFLVATGIRWLGLVALATLIGSLVLRDLVLPSSMRASPGARRLARLAIVCVVVLLATTVGELITRAQTMAGGNLTTAIAAVPAVLSRTHFGAIWTARLALLVLALVALFGGSTPARLAALGAGAAIALTSALTGHAADWGDLTPSAAIDWAHVLAVSAWTGGLIALSAVVLPAARDWPSASLAAVMQRFSRLAGICLPIAVLSGGYNAWTQVSPLSAVWTTAYGRTLLVKLVFVLALMWWGALNRYLVVPALGRRHRAGIGERWFRLARLALRGPSGTARRARGSRLRAFVAREAVVAGLVFGCTAVLVDSTPARHADHFEHQAAPEPGPVHVTMEDLHRSGGVPSGWVFSPPAGDAERGRQLFGTLGCGRCHAVRGERVAASPGIGPELTGVGHHHPAAYLLESILNPNAVVVDGRGYTGSDGRSIMPDYRGQISVADLIDLVAYLKTL